jgi:hypothetical protein
MGVPTKPAQCGSPLRTTLLELVAAVRGAASPSADARMREARRETDAVRGV